MRTTERAAGLTRDNTDDAKPSYNLAKDIFAMMMNKLETLIVDEAYEAGLLNAKPLVFARKTYLAEASATMKADQSLGASLHLVLLGDPRKIKHINRTYMEIERIATNTS